MANFLITICLLWGMTHVWSPRVLAASKSDVLNQLGELSYEVDYFEPAAFESVILKSSQTERAQNEDYQKIYQKYLAWGVKAQIEFVKNKPKFNSSESSNNQKSADKTLESYSPRLTVPQFISLVPFKTGDLQRECATIVTKAKQFGFESVTLFYPVHFSGGNSKNYQQPAAPQIGKHYHYEVTHALLPAEVEACLNFIAQSNMELHYVPHLESIVTLTTGEEEWRLLSGIPIDEHYFAQAFAPLMNFLKKYPRAFKKPLHITLAAEIDPSVFSYAQALRKGWSQLREELRKLNVGVAGYYWNTNGDFYHGLSLIQERGKNCSELELFLKDITALTPSMYVEKDHFVLKNENIQLAETLNKYRSGLMKRLKEVCPENKFWEEIIAQKPIGFGECALDETKANSYLSLENNKMKNPLEKLYFLNYWNYGKWDHLGLRESKASTRFKDQLLLRRSRTPAAPDIYNAVSRDVPLKTRP
jgi:hypothetical protein